MASKATYTYLANSCGKDIKLQDQRYDRSLSVPIAI